MNLPRLLYLSDVPVEATYHGSALMHRLLGGWPAEKLLIIEPGFARSQPSGHLPKVAYRTLPFGIPRLLHSRLADFYGSFVLATAKARRRALQNVVGDFQPEAVLTVTHGYSWITAAAYAAERRLPLHVVCHDDWLMGVRILRVLKLLAGSWFGEYYRQAASRFCVSPFMVEGYERKYGVGATVLYPSRAPDCPEHQEPPARVANQSVRPVFAYAGTINGAGYVRAIRCLADALNRRNGRLLIYGPTSQKAGKSLGLDQPNIEFRGLLKSNELIPRLRDEADVLYVPMSFDDGDRLNMEVGFPSKLTDYTATGIPLLIHGPAYCSAIRWARENPGVAEIVESEDDPPLADALTRLCRDSSLRWQLGVNALRVGRSCFDHSLAVAKLQKTVALASNSHPRLQTESNS